ncbi:hypothetical protein NJF84_21255, partial [Stenotrophomonas maltophilia]|nr:hypothetical protein [Stenotrophomonas maltophilia]
EGTLPALDGATGWLNSPPLTAQQLRGKVVLVEFWTPEACLGRVGPDAQPRSCRVRRTAHTSKRRPSLHG